MSAEVEVLQQNGVADAVKENGTAETVKQNGTAEALKQNGVADAAKQNGTSVKENGTTETVKQNGTTETVKQNGTTEVVKQNGGTETSASNGITEAAAKDNATENGTTEAPNGSTAEPQYHRKFGAKTNALDVLKDVDLAGKTYLVTGTTAGIGTETARVLALKGAHVVMANRNIVLSEEVRDNIYKETENRNIDILNVDLSSLQSVQAAAKEFISKGWPLHGLILNAGVYAPQQKTTIDGYESTFGINHLGHFYLTYLLLDKLRESAPSRVVIVSSSWHSKSGIDSKAKVEDQLAKLIPAPESREFVFRLYAYSKLCNILMAFKLHREEFEKNNVHVYVLHPGNLIGTKIARSYGLVSKVLTTITKPFVKTISQGASTTVYCAASPDVENESGKYYDNCWDEEKNLHKSLAHNQALQDALWTKSLELVKKFEESQQR